MRATNPSRGIPYEVALWQNERFMRSEAGSKPLPAGRRSSVDEVPAQIGVSRDTVYRWMERKALPAHRLGRLWKLKLSEVDAWVRAGSAHQK